MEMPVDMLRRLLAVRLLPALRAAFAFFEVPVIQHQESTYRRGEAMVGQGHMVMAWKRLDS
jgi:hypothetical protein